MLNEYLKTILQGTIFLSRTMIMVIFDKYYSIYIYIYKYILYKCTGLKYTGDRYFSICILEYVYEQKFI